MPGFLKSLKKQFFGRIKNIMWIFFSVLSVLCFATVNIIDKYVLTKWIRQPLVLVVILGLFNWMSATVIYFIRGFSYLSSFNILLNLIAGTSSLLAGLFYFKALKVEEVSRVTPLFYLSTLFISLFAAIFLGEVFTPLKYLGIFLLVFGAIFVSSKNPLKLSFSKALPLMLLSVTAGSASSLLVKYLLNFTDYWTVFSYLRIGGGIVSIPIAYIYLPSLISAAKKYGKRFIVVITINGLMGLSAMLFFVIAISLGYVTLVSAIAGIQPFFILLFTVTLTMFFPSIIKEEIKRSVVFVKLLAIITMFIGVILIV